MRFSFTAILLFIPLVAAAVDWQFLASTDTVKIFIDKSSIQQKDDTVEFDFKDEYLTPQKTVISATLYYAAQGHEIVNCKARTYKVVSVSYYDKDNRLLNRASTPPSMIPFSPVLPNSRAEAKLEYVCALASI